jgi:hypothetical protein
LCPQNKATNADKTSGNREASRFLLTRFMLQNPVLFFGDSDDTETTATAGSNPSQSTATSQAKDSGKRKPKEARTSPIEQPLGLEVCSNWPGVIHETEANKIFLLNLVCICS